MKEIIYHVVASTPGRVISIAVDEVLTKDNILGIINKTTGKVLYTPLKYPKLTFGLSAGTMTLTLDSSIPSISVGDHLLIKVYTDDDGYAKEAQATSNKNEVKQEIRNVAGSCIIPDFELPCLPFVPEGFCAIYGDADYMIGDFAPQTVAEQFEVGSIIHVTGDNATEEDFEGYPEGSLMAVAKTTLKPTGYAEGLYQDIECHMQGITEDIVWQKGGYYRVTGIIECYSELTEDSITIFTYEELDPATLTDLAKQAVEMASKSADMVKDFFGIVKDGDTVKVVTEDGGEEVVVPVGLMDEDDVYDHLEDVAVLLGGITAQQAAAITAATRAIIHGGSGSGEGGEGGSGSGEGGEGGSGSGSGE